MRIHEDVRLWAIGFTTVTMKIGLTIWGKLSVGDLPEGSSEWCPLREK